MKLATLKDLAKVHKVNPNSLRVWLNGHVKPTIRKQHGPSNRITNLYNFKAQTAVRKFLDKKATGPKPGRPRKKKHGRAS